MHAYVYIPAVRHFLYIYIHTHYTHTFDATSLTNLYRNPCKPDRVSNWYVCMYVYIYVYGRDLTRTWYTMVLLGFPMCPIGILVWVDSIVRFLTFASRRWGPRWCRMLFRISWIA